MGYELRFYWQLQIESKVILSTKLSVEGPLRLKEEYIEGILETPSVSEQAVPEQLKGTFNQAVNTMQQLPVPIKDVLASGLKVPLGMVLFHDFFNFINLLKLVGCLENLKSFLLTFSKNRRNSSKRQTAKQNSLWCNGIGHPFSQVLQSRSTL